MATGIQTIHAPSGSREKNAMMTPQNTGAPIPSSANVMPPIAPCTSATMSAGADAGANEIGGFADAPFAERRIERQTRDAAGS